MKTLDFSSLTAFEKQSWLTAAVAPRPIALASTVSSAGKVNLSPFSFFNVFSTDPAIVVFAPNLRVRDGSRKHTIMNLEEVPEVAIGIVDFSILGKVNQASADYPYGVNEFIEAGLTEMASVSIRPPWVKECRVSMECKMIELKTLGSRPGSGTLVIAEVQCMHLNEEILDAGGGIDPGKFHQVARLGDDWYVRMDESVLFRLPKPTN